MSSSAEELVSRANSLLVLDHPFYGATLLRKPITLSDNVPTFGITPQGRIFANPDFVETLSPNQVVFALAHECWHYMLMHSVRRGERNPMRWNIAGDMVINERLIADRVGEFIPGVARMEGAAEMTTEQVYDLLSERVNGSAEVWDDLLPGEGEMTSAEIRAIEAQVQIDIAQAVSAAKMQGKLPASVARFVNDIINPPTPWHVILLDYMQGMTRDETTWSRPNRRFISRGIYLPSTSYTPEMGTVVLGIDTSGSVSGEALSVAQGHMNRIAELCRPEELIVVYCDAKVQGEDRYTAEDLPMTFKSVRGGGGTDLRHLFHWVDQLDEAPDVMVVFTDGMTPFPDAAPEYPVVWINSRESSKYPFGEVVPWR